MLRSLLESICRLSAKKYEQLLMQHTLFMVRNTTKCDGYLCILDIFYVVIMIITSTELIQYNTL